jgi:hypothetical protein
MQQYAAAAAATTTTTTAAAAQSLVPFPQVWSTSLEILL